MYVILYLIFHINLEKLKCQKLWDGGASCREQANTENIQPLLNQSDCRAPVFGPGSQPRPYQTFFQKFVQTFFVERQYFLFHYFDGKKISPHFFFTKHFDRPKNAFWKMRKLHCILKLYKYFNEVLWKYYVNNSLKVFDLLTQTFTRT